MKIQKYKFEKNEILQIYIKKSEQEDLKIIKKINELKNIIQTQQYLLVEKMKL